MERLYSGNSKVIKYGEQIITAIPSNIRSVLKPKHGDNIEWIVYPDRRIEIVIVKNNEG